MLLDLFQLLCFATTVSIFSLSAFMTGLNRGLIGYHFPKFYAKAEQFYLKSIKFLFPLAAVIILVGGIFVLSELVYGIWVLLVLYITLLTIKGKRQGKPFEEVSLTEKMWLDFLLQVPLGLAAFAGAMALPSVVAVLIGNQWG